MLKSNLESYRGGVTDEKWLRKLDLFSLMKILKRTC
jgi:hypothetical protein